MARADQTSHPTRLRILQAMLGDRQATTADLARDLPDVSPASLYRHISSLNDAGYLEIVSETRVRGAVERTYRLPPERQLGAEFTLADREKAATLSDDERRAAFAVFATTLIASYDGYLAREDSGVTSDAVGYRTRAVYVDEADVAELTEVLNRALEQLTGEVTGKRRVLLSTVMIPT